MKKLFIISFLLFFFFFFIAISAYLTPFYIYKKIIQENFTTEWYKPNFTSKMLAGSVFSPSKLSESHEDRYWKLFHIKDYKIFLPINHPLLTANPVVNIEDEKDAVTLGLQFITQNSHPIIDINFNKNKKFQTILGSQKLFKIAIFESYLEKKALTNIWTDMFLKDLSLDSNKSKNDKAVVESDNFFKKWFYNLYANFEDTLNLIKLSYTDLIYNLYILQFRSIYLPSNALSFFYDDTRNLAIIELAIDGRMVKNTIVMFLSNGYIESYSIVQYLSDLSSSELYQRMYDTIYYAESSSNISKLVYGQFVDLPYYAKTNDQGMFYLFSAWSHKIDDKEFLREIIRFLERGQSNLLKLQPFYYYAFKKYGTNFSSKRDDANSLSSSSASSLSSSDNPAIPSPPGSNASTVDGKLEELKDKITEENDGKMEKMRENSDNKEEATNFKNPNDKTKYLLQKTKDEEISDKESGKIDDDNKSMSFD
ncbi:MAG: hypothetical protein HQK51_08960 [Oligoflexia bacterium]|nr:hypothetical protein [Oligoflexia bacterium]